MGDVATAWSPAKRLDVGNPENDDPSLLLLFQHLKSKSLQTAKGISEISGKLEFDFVLHNVRVFFRMSALPFPLVCQGALIRMQDVIRLPWISCVRGPSNGHSSRHRNPGSASLV